MVDTPLKPRQPQGKHWLLLILALLAVAFLITMMQTGSLPETRQLAKYEAKGVLKVTPDHLRRVELTIGEQTVTFVRDSDQRWRRSGTHNVVADELQEHLSMAVLLMHGSGPVRVMPKDEYQGTTLEEFGLERPRYAVALSDGQRLLLEAHFGGHNPQELLQYMRLTGSDDVYLMSRFVGQALEHIWEHVRQQTAVP
jgi:hypothetical protein